MKRIRLAEAMDLERISEIYNESVANSTATFDTEPRTGARLKEWFQAHDRMHPIVVVEIENKILGWASLSKWSEKKAYDSSAEISVYLDALARGKGLGKDLVSHLTLMGKELGLHMILARITEGNEISLQLFRKAGYLDCGTLREAGMKFGKYHDVHLLQIVF